VNQSTKVACRCGWKYHAEVKNDGEWKGKYLPVSCPECGREFEWEVKDEDK